VLTHRDLHLHPVVLRGQAIAPTLHCAESSAAGWFSPQQWRGLGLPAPVRKLLDAL